MSAEPFSILPVEFGRYRVVKLLGRGGMGSVYLAEDTKLGNRKVALKLPARLESDENEKRFLREARAAAILDHANICPVFDIGTEDGRLYLAMKYVGGRTLAHEIDPARPWDEARAVRLVVTLARALHYAHENGVIHRDLKPVNVMLPSADVPVVMDFGLAKLEGATTLTYNGAIFGTPAYMPLEQARGELHEVGPWSDVYSLGVTLFELLTGRRPFGGSALNIISQLALEPIPGLRKYRADAGPAVEEICLRAMAKRPADRYASMQEFADDLQEQLDATSGGDRTPTFRPTVRQHPTPVREPGDRTVLTLPDKREMQFAWCPRGAFMMGATVNDFDADADERPQHPVQIASGFYLGTCEVTRWQFAQFVDATGYATDAERNGGGYCYVDGRWSVDPDVHWRTPGYRQRDDHPVVAVTWNDAQRYVDWLNGIRPGHRFRLPTEAEWEYACRAGTTWRYMTGNSPKTLEKTANVKSPERRTTPSTPAPTFAEHYVFTSPVGRFEPNEWGLYDMVGNVWEWCEDWYDKDFYAASPKVDPVNINPGPYRVCRGGSGSNNAVVCRASYRNRYEPDRAVNILGFRIAYSAD